MARLKMLWPLLAVTGCNAQVFAAVTTTTTPATRDVSYLSDGGAALQATFYRPAGAGPFPLVVYVHGGGWTSGTREGVKSIAEALAIDGIAVFAIDFRMPPAAGYPASLANINYAVRYVKQHATEFATRPALVGLMGESSGGHQAVLAALRPMDTRYNAMALPGGAAIDARVNYVVSCWGVLDPLARYRYAEGHGMTAMVAGHQAYWGGEAQMAEGNPQLILDRREAINKPAILVIYGTADQNVPNEIPERFVRSYRQAGGAVELQVYKDAPHGFIRAPFDAASLDALDKIHRFIHAQTSAR